MSILLSKMKYWFTATLQSCRTSCQASQSFPTDNSPQKLEVVGDKSVSRGRERLFEILLLSGVDHFEGSKG